MRWEVMWPWYTSVHRKRYTHRSCMFPENSKRGMKIGEVSQILILNVLWGKKPSNITKTAIKTSSTISSMVTVRLMKYPAPNFPNLLLGHLEAFQTQALSNKGRQSFSPDYTNYHILVENDIHTCKKRLISQLHPETVTCCIPYAMLLIFITLCFSNKRCFANLTHIEAA